MNKERYEKQVALLLQVLPEVAKVESFALHGGTCINLFVRNMLRLSVDIDLTYIPIADRETSLSNILKELGNIASNIKRIIPYAVTDIREKEYKLIVSVKNVVVKIEVSVMNRGLFGNPERRVLCEKAQETFDAFCEISTVSLGQLYGGKICAALDRQHPRDLFDVKYLLENEGFTQEIKEGFLLMLLCSERPMNEMLAPHLLDQHIAFENQFEGMTRSDFTYEDYENSRLELIKIVNQALTKEDKHFLLDFKNLIPDWSLYSFSEFPGVKWKLFNLDKLKTNNPDKHVQLFNKLKAVLEV